MFLHEYSLISPHVCFKDVNSMCSGILQLTATQHIQLLKDAVFSKVHIFWCSYMQMGIYGIK